MAVATLIACGRLVPRLLQQQRLNVSDWFLVASILDALGLFITDTLTYKWGGMSDEDLGESEEAMKKLIALKKVRRSMDFPTNLGGTENWILMLLQVQFAGNAFYDTGIYLPKIAVLALYFKLFPPTMPWLRRVLYAVTGFNVAAMVATFCLDTFWCGGHVAVNWSLEEGACSAFDSETLFRIDWALNISSDVLSEWARVRDTTVVG